MKIAPHTSDSHIVYNTNWPKIEYVPGTQFDFKVIHGPLETSEEFGGTSEFEYDPDTAKYLKDILEKTKTTVSVLIGNTDGKLDQVQWAEYVGQTKAICQEFAESIWFSGGPANWELYQNYCIVMSIDKEFIQNCRSALIKLRIKYNQDSIAWVEGKSEFI